MFVITARDDKNEFTTESDKGEISPRLSLFFTAGFLNWLFILPCYVMLV